MNEGYYKVLKLLIQLRALGTELIPGFGCQPAADISHKPDGIACRYFSTRLTGFPGMKKMLTGMNSLGSRLQEHQ